MDTISILIKPVAKSRKRTATITMDLWQFQYLLTAAINGCGEIATKILEDNYDCAAINSAVWREKKKIYTEIRAEIENAGADALKINKEFIL